MELEHLAVFLRHLVETMLRQLVVIVVVAQRNFFDGLRERPESIERDVFTQFHRDARDHQARGQAVRSHPFSSPEKSEVSQVPGVEEENLLPHFGLFECLVDFKRDAGVDPIGKGWQKEECISIGGNILQKPGFLLLQILVLQSYDAGIDSHKIRFASNIFTSTPCDWGEVTPEDEV